MSEKIQPIHIDREACVYIRQSSMQQVRTRLEGQRRQYDLRERAQALGFQRVVVIDEDQGRSGTGSVERPGFGRSAGRSMLRESGCGLGVRGLSSGKEQPRLAPPDRSLRHGRDTGHRSRRRLRSQSAQRPASAWPQGHHERVRDQFAATAGDGGASTEGGRGLVLTQVPVGYVRTEDEGMEKTPDRQIQEAIAGIFRKFASWAVCVRFCSGIATRKLLIPCTLARVRQPQGSGSNRSIQHLRHPQEPDLCRCLRLGQEAYSHLHRGWPRP
jgi:hypothetical protein